MAKHTALPVQVLTNVAAQAQDHLPTELPPVPTTQPTEVTLPSDADHMSLTGVNNLPDFLGF
jgi:hypothetical protein